MMLCIYSMTLCIYSMTLYIYSMTLSKYFWVNKISMFLLLNKTMDTQLTEKLEIKQQVDQHLYNSVQCFKQSLGFKFVCSY